MRPITVGGMALAPISKLIMLLIGDILNKKKLHLLHDPCTHVHVDDGCGYL